MHFDTPGGGDATARQQHGPGRIGPYEVFQLLGEGGMGRVFLARSPGARLVALKVIRPEYAEAPDFRGRFRREADAARKVSGFFTPPVLDADADAEQPWLATAYIPAPSLQDVVRRFGTLSGPALRALGAGLAEALLAIHAAGIVHRDLKPGNVLVAHDGPRVIDFGISRAVDATRVTRTNAVIGTPGFMAPEQIMSSREAGPAADVFSLGCVLVFAGTGRGPFGTGGIAEILYRAVHAPPRLDDVPDTVRPLVAACLEKDPARRPALPALLPALGDAEPSALLTPGLREDLAARAAHAAALVGAPPIPDAPQVVAVPGRLSRRHLLQIAAAVAGTAAAAAGAAAVTGWTPGHGRTTARSGSAGTTIRPSAPVPAVPAPRWTRPVKARLENARLRLLGSTLVHWDQDNAVGYDAKTGSERWTASPDLPPDVSGKPTWLGVHGSALYGTARSDRGHLLALDGNGALRFSHAVTEPDETSYVDAVYCVAGAVALIATRDNQGYGVRAVDLTAGAVLWSRAVASSSYYAYSDGRTCFLHDDGALHGMDLRTGKVRWTVRDVPGDYLATAGKALLVISVEVQAFDAADGRKRWSAIHESTYLSATVSGDRAYVVDGQDTVFALEPRDGSQLWHTASPLPLSAGYATGQELSASSSLVAASLAYTPGFVALRASDGRLLWAHQASGSEAASTNPWSVQAVGTTVYAASDTTLYAFRSGTS